MTKHRVSEETYRKWQFDTGFTDEIDQRIAAAHRESSAIIARVAPFAANRLIELSKSPKEEIARRACLNIISLSEASLKQAKPPRQPGMPEAETISSDTASKLLAVLAEAAGTAAEDAAPEDRPAPAAPAEEPYLR